jgi:hypothetical protein
MGYDESSVPILGQLKQSLKIIANLLLNENYPNKMPWATKYGVVWALCL